MLEELLDQQKETLVLQPSGASLARRISQVEKYKEESRIGRETLKAALAESPEYEAAAEEAKLAVQKKKQLRDAIWSSQDNQKLLAMIKENAEEIATLEEILATELMDVYTQQNIDEVANEDGEVRKFKVTVKLLPKSGKSDFR